MVGGITASITISNYGLSDSEYYTTVSDNEIIPFTDSDSRLREINDITFEAGNNDIKVRLCRIDNVTDKNIKYISDVLYSKINSGYHIEGVSYNAIKIEEVLGKEIKWIANGY